MTDIRSIIETGTKAELIRAIREYGSTYSRLVTDRTAKPELKRILAIVADSTT